MADRERRVRRTPKITVYLPPATLAWIQAWADRDGCSLSTACAVAIGEYRRLSEAPKEHQK